MGNVPTLEETEKAVRSLKPDRAAGPDGVPPGIFLHGGPLVLQAVHQLICKMWTEEIVPKSLRDANIVILFKKSDRSLCGNYRGISLLAAARMAFSKILLTCLTQCVAQYILPETNVASGLAEVHRK